MLRRISYIQHNALFWSERKGELEGGTRKGELYVLRPLLVHRGQNARLELVPVTTCAI